MLTKTFDGIERGIEYASFKAWAAISILLFAALCVADVIPFARLELLPFIFALLAALVVALLGGALLAGAAKAAETGATRLIAKHGLPPSVKEVVLGFGTSCPELFSATIALFVGQPGAFIVGGLIGSNLLNTGLILGGGVFAAKRGREFAFPVKAALWHAVMAFASVGVIALGAPWWGLLGLVGLAVVTVFYMLPQGGKKPQKVEVPGRPGLLLAIALAALAIAVVVCLGGITTGGSLLAAPAILMGLLVAAITSAPEALVSIPATARGEKDLGDVAGVVVSSNAFNTAIFAVLGLLAAPFGAMALPFSWAVIIPTLGAAFGALWILVAARRGKMGRIEAGIVIAVTLAVTVAAAG